MEHAMHLKDEPFRWIWDGKKTIELRLMDEKRKKIAVGDTIRFSNLTDGSREITVRVVALHTFDSFETLYKTLPMEKCGYAPGPGKADPKDMNAYYPEQEQRRWGVVGIEFAVIKRV